MENDAEKFHHEGAKGTKVKVSVQSRRTPSFVLLSLKVFAVRANFPVVIQTISVQKRIHRGDAEYAEKRIL